MTLGREHETPAPTHAAGWRSLRSRWPAVRPADLAYAVFAFAAVGWVCHLFVGSMLSQMFLSAARVHDDWVAHVWSAPLDDVFIHFDFARSTARGYPFEWVEGNGYSSGGTSLTYPFVLAVGYLVGFEGLWLMRWAVLVAAVCTFGTLLAARRVFGELPVWTHFLAPPFLLGVGALSWSLFSGMEVAWYLGIWGLALVAWDDLWRVADEEASQRIVVLRSLTLGGALAALTATRPESAGVVAVFSLTAGSRVLATAGWRPAIASVASSALPAVLVLVAHATANYSFTGDASAAGALAKLELHHPLLSRQEVWAQWREFVVRQVLRLTEHHVSAEPLVGWGLWLLAAVGLLSRQARRFVVLLWLSAVVWTLTVALNGQVVWQNNRYSMPALAWILLAAALGLGVSLDAATRVIRVHASLPRRTAAIALAASAVCVTALLVTFQEPRFRDQIWFFGRASRNIFDQHMIVGKRLRSIKARDVLVGDAGAIPYVADIPALDIIGLGGYHRLPFARAQRWNVAAAIELIQNIEPHRRPDSMALYPSWWGAFPLWFGEPLFGVPVRGNVICGGHTKMVYRPEWGPLTGTNRPSLPDRHLRLVDSLDAADLTSERPHAYRTQEALGYVVMKMLPHPKNPDADLWDAGRILPTGSRASFELDGFVPFEEVVLVLRNALPSELTLQASVNGADLDPVLLPAADAWQEQRIVVPREHVAERLQVTLRPTGGEYVLYHLWALQK